MKWLYKIVRTILVTLIALVMGVPALLYALLSLPMVHERMRTEAEKALTGLLGVPVSISAVEMEPFNRVALRGVTLADPAGGVPLAMIDRLGAGVNYMASIEREAIVVNYVEIIGLYGHVSRDSVGSPLNIQPVLDALKPKEPSKGPMRLVLEVNSVLIRKGAVTYDVLSAPPPQPGRFDASHIGVDDLRADIRIPRIADKHYAVDVMKLRCQERSGMAASLTGNFLVSDSLLSARNFSLEFGDGTRLLTADMEVPLHSLQTIGEDLRTAPLSLRLLPGTTVYISDFGPLVPALSTIDTSLGITLDVAGTLPDLTLHDLRVVTPSGLLSLEAEGRVLDVAEPSRSVSLTRLDVRADGPFLASVMEKTGHPDRALLRLLQEAGGVRLTADGSWEAREAKARLSLTSNLMEATVKASASGDLAAGSMKLGAEMDVARAEADVLSSRDSRFGHFAAKVTAAATLASRRLTGATARVDVEALEYNEAYWNDVLASAEWDGSEMRVHVDSDDSEALFDLNATARISVADLNAGRVLNARDINADLRVRNLCLHMIPGCSPQWRDYTASVSLLADLDSPDPAAPEGTVEINDLTLRPAEGDPVFLGDIDVEMHGARPPMWATVESDLLDADLHGNFHLPSLARDCREVLSRMYPSLIPAPGDRSAAAGPNDCKLDVTIKDSRTVERLIKLPVSVVHPVEINAVVSSTKCTMALDVDAPYLLQGRKVIENTGINVALNGDVQRGFIYATTVTPTKNGPMAVTFDGVARLDSVYTCLQWEVESPRAFSGELLLAAKASRDEEGTLAGAVDISPSTLAVNDTLWQVGATRIDIAPQRIVVAPWRIGSRGNAGQYLTIGGTASPSEDDIVTVGLHDIDLDYLFGTLNINNVDFGGRATGTVTARRLLSPLPLASTDDLDVRGLKYNGAVFGDAIIRSAWDGEDQAITLDADITGRKEGGSTVDGRIWPTRGGGGLDLTFGADHSPVEFLQPFMAAFCSRVTGTCSGRARLYGTFSDLDLEGKVLAEDVALTIPFTNTTYTTTDSIAFAPGEINLQGITLRDTYGHTAKLSGWLKHRYFHDPVFEFRLHDADNLLCYDMPESPAQPWYGKIYASGGAVIDGKPGVVNIGINVTTSPGSTFGFILSDTESAGEYTFITFRDRDSAGTSLSEREYLVPEAVRNLRSDKKSNDEVPTVFNMSINVRATPGVDVTLVMDPMAGDRIRARGDGDLRLTYNSATDDMQIFGTYTLQRGSYNFTFQDIIVKDFTIDPGSSIAFHGNPYMAQLDITAAYQTTANLTDLDESFKDDKDLNRTSVPVRAMLMIRGDMRQPDLSFDLNFPTLTSDVDRKVRSLVNTEEMMSRQVIYLLALNRFYTPEYNTGANKNNEFTSLATNTLSSRIGSLLGSISDNWTIAPSLRSEHGDFSDVEVDLALSSHLLNNRLLINGNLGYRDKALNTSSFIGDFDIEYLLNRSGTIRLKAYNRFNDQTFYVKNALTTQGAGVVFTRDFDSLTSWLRPLRRRKSETTPTDTLIITPAPTELQPDANTAPRDTLPPR